MKEAERDLLLVIAKFVVCMDKPSTFDYAEWDKFRDGVRTVTDIVERP